MSGDDPDPLVEQVVELPEKLRHIVHHRRHTLTCPCCSTATTAPSVPDAANGFGPRFQAITAYLSGVGRMGKRPIRQLCDDLFGVPLSLGSVSRLEAKTSRALEPIHAEARAALSGKDANVDETGWKEGGKRAWLWVAGTNLVSVFLIHRHRSREAFEELIPSRGVLTTDRYPVYSHLEPGKRQVCWAQVREKSFGDGPSWQGVSLPHSGTSTVSVWRVHSLQWGSDLLPLRGKARRIRDLSGIFQVTQSPGMTPASASRRRPLRKSAARTAAALMTLQPRRTQ